MFCLSWCSQSQAGKKECIKIKTLEITQGPRLPSGQEGRSWLTEEFQPESAQINPLKSKYTPVDITKTGRGRERGGEERKEEGKEEKGREEKGRRGGRIGREGRKQNCVH